VGIGPGSSRRREGSRFQENTWEVQNLQKGAIRERKVVTAAWNSPDPTSEVFLEKKGKLQEGLGPRQLVVAI